jgi:hypothetical protein
MFEIGETRFEAGDQSHQRRVLCYQPGVIRSDSNVFGDQSSALGEQLLDPVAALHFTILTRIARSVVDHRALRAQAL